MICMSMEINENGALKVIAEDNMSGMHKGLIITNSGRWSTDEIAKMIAEVEKLKMKIYCGSKWWS